jgi:type VI secretion system protein
MFTSKSLLERLSKPKAGAKPTLSEDTGELVRSVLRHLQRLLNSRKGHAPAQPDYGIPDSSEVVHSLPGAIREMQKAIKQSIEMYEPRLCHVDVVHVEVEGEELTLRFQITAQLSTPKDRPHVCFETLFDSAGRIQVKS